MKNFDLKTITDNAFAQLVNFNISKNLISEETTKRDSGLVGAFSNFAFIAVNLDINSNDKNIRKSEKAKRDSILSKVENQFSLSYKEVVASFMNKFNNTHRHNLVIADSGEANNIEFILEIFEEEELKTWNSFRNYQREIVEAKKSKAGQDYYNECMQSKKLDKLCYPSGHTSNLSPQAKVIEEALHKAILKIDVMNAKIEKEKQKEAEQAEKENKKQAKPKQLAMVA